MAHGGRGGVLLAGDGMKASMSSAAEVGLTGSDELQELASPAHGGQGAVTSLARPNVHIRDFEVPADDGIELGDADLGEEGGAEEGGARKRVRCVQHYAKC